MRIDRATCDELESAAELGALATRGHHVVIQIARCEEPSLRATIARLAAALPDHSVFWAAERTITVLRVVGRDVINAHLDAIRAAVAEYRTTCRTLVAQYQAGTLDRAWCAGEHGMECRFVHDVTGQYVDAPLTASRPVDPYFFAMFVKSTPSCARVAALIAEDFHDAARMLDVLGDDE